MNISINGVLYQDVQWDSGVLTLTTDMTLPEIEIAFAPGGNTNIILYEDEEEVGRYYNKGIESMTVRSGEVRTVVVEFNITRINGDAEEELNNSIEESNDAIFELAEIAADYEENKIKYNEYEETLDRHGARISGIETNDIPGINERLARLERAIGGLE